MSDIITVLSLCVFLPICSFVGTINLLEDRKPSMNKEETLDKRKTVKPIESEQYMTIKQEPYNPYYNDNTNDENEGIWF
jgi:hypothetical protein